MTSTFTIELMDSNEQDLEKLPPWGVSPFTFQGKFI